MNWVRRHSLVMIVAVFGTLSFVVFTWAEYGYFCDQGREHGNEGCESFWSMAHIHDWVYNAASNYQSELLFGILVILLLKRVASDRDEDKSEV